MGKTGSQLVKKSDCELVRKRGSHFVRIQLVNKTDFRNKIQMVNKSGFHPLEPGFSMETDSYLVKKLDCELVRKRGSHLVRIQLVNKTDFRKKIQMVNKSGFHPLEPGFSMETDSVSQIPLEPGFSMVTGLETGLPLEPGLGLGFGFVLTGSNGFVLTGSNGFGLTGSNGFGLTGSNFVRKSDCQSVRNRRVYHLSCRQERKQSQGKTQTKTKTEIVETSSCPDSLFIV